MTRHKPRSPRSDELELWRRVSKTARPLNVGIVNEVKNRTSGHKPSTSEIRTESFELKPFTLGELASSTKPLSASQASSASTGKASRKLDKSILTKLRRGKLRPEARIDLHGMTVDEALPSLTRFLFRAQSDGRRLVLVITGKGRTSGLDSPFPSQPGVLRRSLPLWVSRPPLVNIVQEITEAHQRHGGSGAFYVYLRRNT